MSLAVSNPSRDPRVEDPTNRWLIDPIARALVPLAVRLDISANAISISGVVVGGIAAFAYERWQHPWHPLIGLIVTLVWLVFDSMDGTVARATGTSSAFGKELDGLCDHAVFAMLYIALAISVGGVGVWLLMIAAALVHAVQANLYEAERDRFHRRLANGKAPAAAEPMRGPAGRLYNKVASAFERVSAPFDAALASRPGDRAPRDAYERGAVAALRMMVLLSQNIRLIAIFIACAVGQMTLFLWFELIPLSIVTIAGILWLRRVERRVTRLMLSGTI